MKRLHYFSLIIPAFFFAFISCNSNSTDANQEADANYTEVVINVSGMTCTGCEEAISGGLQALEAVKEVKADFEQGKAWVTYNESAADLSQLTSAVEATGYQVTGTEAVLSE